MYWISKSIHILNRFRRQLIIFLSVLGPGIIVMVADNDAGGISTYAVTGSKYGFSLLWMFVFLVPMAFYVQEMTVRVGAVTKRGHAEAIFDGFGPFWGWFSIVDLAIINWLTLITEYIGMTAAMSLLGVPPWITFTLVTIILLAIVVSGRYWTFEKLALFFCIFNFVYIPAAFWAMKTPTAPSWGHAFRDLFSPHLSLVFNGDLIFIIMANIGTTIAPWMIFFQQSAVVDKGLDVHDIKFGRLDTLIGCFLTCTVAVFIIIATGAVFYYHRPPITIQDAKQTAEAIVPLLPSGYGEVARKLFAIGLFDAGFLGALCISLSSSWAVGEVCGWSHSLNYKVREAPWFYTIYVLMLVTSGMIVLIPGAPLVTITMFVQVVAVTLLPASLVFLLIILNDESCMGEHTSTTWENVANWTIVIIVIFMSTLLAINTLFPGLFR
ncbi:MAG: divalent metal cation transporter [Candidatus Eisenbacteria bacterium]|nr:divalent metal cation transporter [Candidatus Eisenbacteria bacterium]